MKAYIIMIIGILLFSYLLGVIIKGVCKLDNFIETNTTIGFLTLLAILYPGYFTITDYFSNYVNISNLYITYTIVVLIIILIISALKYKSIIQSIKKIDFRKLVIALSIFVVLSFLFINTKYNFRTDDINFYGEYITNRIYHGKTINVRYDYQSIYTFVSVLLHISKTYFNLKNPSFGFIINVQGFIGLFLTGITYIDIYNYCNKRINSKLLRYLVFAGTILIFLSDYWMFQYPHFSVTMRFFPIIYILLLFDEYTKDNKFIYVITLSIFYGSLIAINASGLFIGTAILYGFLIFSIINKRNKYIRDCSIVYLYFFSYIWEELYYQRILVITILLFLAVLLVFKLDKHIERILNRFHFGYFLLLLVPISMFIISNVLRIPSDEYFNTFVTSREFFDNINYFDMVPDLFNNNDLPITVCNVAIWMIIVLGCIKNYRFSDFNVSVVLITLITFFNPFVYRFVSAFITNVAFFRLSFTFYNPIILISIVSVLQNNQNKVNMYIICIMISIICVSKVLSIELSKISTIDNRDDYSYIYHTSKLEMNVINSLDQIHINTYNSVIDDEEKRNPFIHDGIIKVASQIYGAQLYSNLDEYYGKFENQLADRFSYQIIDTDEFEQVFSRRIPGYDLPDVDYTKACTLAYDKQLDYVILEAQYNWELQTGLWPCSYQVGEDIGTYRILKMDYEYWQYNIDMGYTEIYEVKDQK